MTIGFIGQGFIGKNYADDFESRGFVVVRYAKEPEFEQNREKIALCDIVFVAVPTPTTTTGFDDSILRAVLPLVGPGMTAVLKSTILPGTTKQLQKDFPNIHILHSPEFLREKSAADDAAHPERNIVGIPEKSPEYDARAKMLLDVLPKAPYELVADSNETELIKYAGNMFLYIKLLYANLLFDFSERLGVDYDVVRAGTAADPRIGPSHLSVFDSSGHSGASPGRGAGGHCFIKDFAALRQQYEQTIPEDEAGIALLRALEKKNCMLLLKSGKDLDLLAAVYGQDILTL